jgi:adenylate cyclase
MARKAHRRALLDLKITEYRGRIVKTTGDGMLVEFASVVDGVCCAVDVQRGMIERNAEVPQEKRIEFRVGIHVGDIIIDGGDIFGDGVNVAARLEGIAEPGGICLSEDAYRQMSGRVQIPVCDLGPQSLKNIAQPVRAYSPGSEAIAALPPIAFPTSRPFWCRSKIAWQVVAGLLVVIAIAGGGATWYFHRTATVPIASAVSADRPQLTPERLSIVVLPFTNLTGDSSQDYLADVITEELTTNLSRIAGSFVIARSTAFTYKGKAIDAKQIGKDLGVRYVLEGSAQQSNNRVRLNAQLISAETGAHLWADRFDADRADLLQMQDEIVTRLARTLEVQLWKVDAARVARTRPGNKDAEDLAMQCWVYNYVNLFRQVYTLCERALEIDPRNARALATMAWKFIASVVRMQSTDPQEDIRRADEFATQAIAADPNFYGAHHMKAWVLFAQKRSEETIVEEERSLALNPSYIDAYYPLCIANSVLGHPERALECADKAMRLSPRDPFLPTFHETKGVAYFLARRDEQAIEWLRRTIAAWSEDTTANIVLAAALALNGNEIEARETVKHYLSLNGVKARTISAVTAQMGMFSDSPFWLAFLKRLSEGLRQAGMPEE